ncbi:hypothetical protein B0I35DRAFT_129275 [Stachybotrys elegans]|uniref:Uncharacterized protein n=1 Tax=Stachybotrys elegans TaxID=80388 RepID=A0A8K0SY95_9HYPO|nr:hypothetical protein B0I35DRAFT_129275 [Stachybotrys elegans]
MVLGVGPAPFFSSIFFLPFHFLIAFIAWVTTEMCSPFLFSTGDCSLVLFYFPFALFMYEKCLSLCYQGVKRTLDS